MKRSVLVHEESMARFVCCVEKDQNCIGKFRDMMEPGEPFERLKSINYINRGGNEP